MNDRIPLVLSRIELRDGVPCWKRNGEPVRGHLDRDGYRRFILSIDTKKYNFALHRVVWLLHHGSWPKLHIDHINHDRLDNRIENLRDVTRSENMLNSTRKFSPRGKAAVELRRKQRNSSVSTLLPATGSRAAVSREPNFSQAME